MKSNRGFSLVEMIVAFAIAAICGLAIFGFMQSGTNNFTRTSNDVGLQYEQQVVVNQVRDLILESTNSAMYDPTDNVLYTYSQDVDITTDPVTYTYTVTKISLDTTSNTLYWASKEFDQSTLPTTLDDIKSAFSADDNRLLGENVSDISFDMTKIEDRQISFTIEFTSEEKTISSTQIVTLRNKLVDTDDMGELFYTLSDTKNSFIKGITISRDGVVFPLSATDTIQKTNTTDVAVMYEATVTGSDYSERDYACQWVITGTKPDGVDVNSATGVVTIRSDVANMTKFTLRAYSVDDPDKFAEVFITVLEGGVYPTSASLALAQDYEETHGKRTYTIIPTANYTNGTVKTGVAYCDLFTYEILRDGEKTSNVVKSNGDFVVSSADNGHTFTIKGTLKQRSATAEPVETNTLTILVEGVPDAAPAQQLVLSTTSTKDNLRGSNNIYVAASWVNASSSYYTYHWTIEPANVEGDSEYGTWGTPDTVNFNKCISFYDSNMFISGTSYTQTNLLGGDTNHSHQGIFIDCKDYLDWTHSYKVKVTCYATKTNDKSANPQRYGAVDEDGNYIGPVEAYLNFERVKFIVTPVDKDQNKNTISTSLKLKNENNNVAFRKFRLAARGLYLDNNSVPNKYGVKGEFTLWNTSPEGLKTLNLSNSGFYGLKECGSGYLGFFVNVNPYYDQWNKRTGALEMSTSLAQVDMQFRITHNSYSSNTAVTMFMPEDKTNIHDNDNLSSMLNRHYYVDNRDRGSVVW